jgi:hypothetical protein
MSIPSAIRTWDPTHPYRQRTASKNCTSKAFSQRTASKNCTSKAFIRLHTRTEDMDWVFLKEPQSGSNDLTLCRRRAQVYRDWCADPGVVLCVTSAFDLPNTSSIKLWWCWGGGVLSKPHRENIIPYNRVPDARYTLLLQLGLYKVEQFWLCLLRWD